MASGDATSAPLAEYFWIAGMDTNSYWNSQSSKSAPQPPVRGTLIAEDLPEAREPEDPIYPTRDDSLNFRPPLDKRHSDKIEQISLGAQAVIIQDGNKTPGIAEAGTFGDNVGSRMSTLSTNSTSPSFADTKRSSQSSNATIIAGNQNGQLRQTTNNQADVVAQLASAGLGFGDFDFDTALRKFATERENFLEDLSFTAGAVQHQPKKPPPVNSRIQKVMEGGNGPPSLAKSGSLRRRISLRDLNSMRRAPSVVNRAAEDVERQCEEWRRDNMSPEERELASSLGERLASERAKLSRLLAKLPSVVSDPKARENLDDEINTTEEKIGLMADLLRPVRHGAASKIEGLTDGESGLWIPRAYGILGKDPSLTSFYKEWLKAIVVPMVDGQVNIDLPPSSVHTHTNRFCCCRYVVNLCNEAMMPVSSKTQIELAIRELHLYARKEALNEAPGSRNVDLYPLFRSLSLENIITLFEYCLAEARIILLSSSTTMLTLASSSLLHLLYPFTWAGIYIPILPARLLSAIEAPCPYISRYGFQNNSAGN
ncbi:hypothetical protein DRE_04833 [Drechslerella stenobrocha 248]|uniref:UDENN domain-containing protein n=1 Tax=Drechslerella stenobrocha 248 TaxID=1043628 RepID=W7HP03_9PEZI|nr:hypothetical protein DRE_04833 [Drechslerella stenobrocha 248]